MTEDEVKKWYELKQQAEQYRNAVQQQSALTGVASNAWPQITTGNAWGGGTGGGGAGAGYYPHTTTALTPPTRDERLEYLENTVQSMQQALLVKIKENAKLTNQVQEHQDAIRHLYHFRDWVKTVFPDTWAAWEMVQKTRERLTK